ncbi:root allergen protein-like isoform X2 [Bidens hawaiensis]|uniref:root allergen protein-like isoform X2 n=1 Tax=Bidens hawaiensis TaxID=980011 RepID=UPI00404A345A
MSSATLQVEIPSKYPVERVFKNFSDFDNIAPKVKPEVSKSIETVEGNGDVGTIKIFTFDDVVPFTTRKYKVDALDVSNHSFSYSFVEGDILMGILNSISYTVKVVPSSDGGSVFQQIVTYNYKGDEKLSEEILKKEKETHEETYKAIEACAAAHA